MAHMMVVRYRSSVDTDISLDSLECPPEVDRIWLWVYYEKSPHTIICPIFYVFKGD